jgi:hypothetical protein
VELTLRLSRDAPRDLARLTGVLSASEGFAPHATPLDLDGTPMFIYSLTDLPSKGVSLDLPLRNCDDAVQKRPSLRKRNPGPTKLF